MSTTTITVSYFKRMEIAKYCHDNISPRRYYLHNAIGGTGWTLKHNSDIIKGEHTYTLEAPSEHITIIALKYGIA